MWIRLGALGQGLRACVLTAPMLWATALEKAPGTCAFSCMGRHREGSWGYNQSEEQADDFMDYLEAFEPDTHLAMEENLSAGPAKCSRHTDFMCLKRMSSTGGTGACSISDCNRGISELKGGENSPEQRQVEHCGCRRGYDAYQTQGTQLGRRATHAVHCRRSIPP